MKPSQSEELSRLDAELVTWPLAVVAELHWQAGVVLSHTEAAFLCDHCFVAHPLLAVGSEVLAFEGKGRNTPVAGQGVPTLLCHACNNEKRREAAVAKFSELFGHDPASVVLGSLGSLFGASTKPPEEDGRQMPGQYL